MRGPPKIIDSCAILSVFNIKNWRGPHKIVNPRVTLSIFNIKKIKRPFINKGFKIKTGQTK